ncbi:MAG TPA: hypothetical protein VF712_07200 [Thermoleophilaceae bacterium]|jgi:hypothetical protein
MRAALPALAALVACLALAPADARALSCAAPERPFSAYADVVFDGVLLSGPRQEPLGTLASPARMQVLRYVKGRGPRVVEIGTDVPLLSTGDQGASYLLTPGLFEPYPGEVYRVFGDTPRGAGPSARLGVVTPHPCGGTFGRRTGSFLHVVPGSPVARYDAGGRRWKAELLRGPGPLRCLRVHPGLDPDAIECERLGSRGRVLAAAVPAGGETWATAIAVTGPDLESIAVDGPLGRAEAAAAGRGRVALVVLAGYAERADLSVTARLRGGRSTALPGFGGGLLVPDPADASLRWGVQLDAAHPRAAGIGCVRFGQRPDTSRPGSRSAQPRHGECGRTADGFFAVRHVDFYDEVARRDRRHATIVFGRAPAGVERVTIDGPDGEREAVAAGAGGPFALMYPPDVDHGDLTVTLHGPGGAELSIAGRRGWNLVRPPRSRLDGQWP